MRSLVKPPPLRFRARNRARGAPGGGGVQSNLWYRLSSCGVANILFLSRGRTYSCTVARVHCNAMHTFTTNIRARSCAPHRQNATRRLLGPNITGDRMASLFCRNPASRETHILLFLSRDADLLCVGAIASAKCRCSGAQERGMYILWARVHGSQGNKGTRAHGLGNCSIRLQLKERTWDVLLTNITSLV